MLILQVLLSLAQQPVPTSMLSKHEWVIRDIIPGRSTHQLADRRWDYLSLLGDTDGDGMSEFTSAAFDYPSPTGSGWQGATWRGWYRFGRAGHQASLLFEEDYPFPLQLLDGEPHGRTMLRSPTADLIGIEVHGYPLFATWIPPNFSSPVAGGAFPGTTHLRFPDLNGDGTDEVVRHHRDGPTDIGVTTMLDGASLLEVWRHYDQPLAGLGWYRPASVVPWPDLNRDRSPDVITTWNSWQGSHLNAILLALDGHTGQVIWRYEDPFSPAVFPVSDCPDVTGDGVDEVVFALNGAADRVVMLDGATGVPIWSIAAGSLFPPTALPGHSYRAIGFTLVPTAVPGGAGEIEILLEAEFDPSWFVLPSRFLYFQIDARTGAFRGITPKPIDQRPWLPDSYESILGAFPYRERIGDWDRDGLIEVATFSYSLSLDLPNNGVWTPRSLAILGLKTLRAPSEQSIGTSFKAEVSIPSAPNHDFTILLSQSFDRTGGQVIDGWRTFLKSDALMQHTRSGPFAGRLDQDGIGSVTVTLPNRPSLSGATIYSKAVIWKLGSASEVWTMSSLGITEIR